VTQHVCGKLGIPVTGVLTGTEIQQLDDSALMVRVEQVNLFCRVAPVQKNRVILALKRCDMWWGILVTVSTTHHRSIRPMWAFRWTVPWTWRKRQRT